MNYTKFLIYLILSSEESSDSPTKFPIENSEKIIQNKIEKEEKIFLNDIFKPPTTEKTKNVFFNSGEYVQIKKTSECSYEYFQKFKHLNSHGILYKFKDNWFDLFFFPRSEKDNLYFFSLETFKKYKFNGFCSHIILFENIPLEAENADYFNIFYKELIYKESSNRSLLFQEKIKYSPFEKNDSLIYSNDWIHCQKPFKKEFSEEDLNQLNLCLSNAIFDFFDRRKLKLHLILN